MVSRVQIPPRPHLTQRVEGNRDLNAGIKATSSPWQRETLPFNHIRIFLRLRTLPQPGWAK